METQKTNENLVNNSNQPQTEDLERIIGLENEVKENLVEIEELERFIENVCDTDEDEEEPSSKIEELLEENEELNDEISEYYMNN